MGKRADAIDRRKQGQADNSGDTDTTNDATIAATREDIAQTRAEMSQTLDAIQEQLDPQRLKDEAVDKVRTEAVTRVQQAADTLRTQAASRVEQVREKVIELRADAEHALEGASPQIQRLRDEAPAQLERLQVQGTTQLLIWRDQARVQILRLIARYQDLRENDPDAANRVLAGIGAGVGLAITLPVLIGRVRASRRNRLQAALEDALD